MCSDFNYSEFNEIIEKISPGFHQHCKYPKFGNYLTLTVDLFLECENYNDKKFLRKSISPEQRCVSDDKNETMELLKNAIFNNVNIIMESYANKSQIIEVCYVFQNQCVKFLQKTHPLFSNIENDIIEPTLILKKIIDLKDFDELYDLEDLGTRNYYTKKFIDLNRDSDDPYFICIKSLYEKTEKDNPMITQDNIKKRKRDWNDDDDV